MKNYRKIIAIVLSLAMVVATFAYLGANENIKTFANEENTEEPTTVQPTTEPEVNPNGFKYTFDSYYNVYPDSNDNGVNLVTQNGTTVEGVTAAASADNAEYAIDNDESTIWNADCENPQWITVDLGEVKTVKEIDMWWYDENTAKDYSVSVSTYGNEFQQVATVDNDSFYDDRNDMIVLNDSISTRYIKIEMTESNSPDGYSLYEIAAYDDSNYVDLVPYLNKIDTTDNLARNKTPVVAHGNHQEMARRYCDGKLDTKWSANKATDNSWFAVDLGDYYNIKDVMVCWSEANAVDYDVYVSSFEDWYGDYPVASVRDLWANKSVSAVSKDINVKARYVKIQVERWSDNSERDGITPCELVVFGEETEGYYNMQDYKWIWPWEYPTLENKLFAGWYTDETMTEVYYEDIGYGYGRFIDEDVLSYKYQLADDGTAIRFVSSLDHMNYNLAGFKFTGTYGEYTISETTKEVETLYTKITADGETIRPKEVFSDESKYFFTYTIRGLDPEIAENMTWEVTPIYKTPDDTKVYGITGNYPRVDTD